MKLLDNLFKKEQLPTIIFNDEETERQTNIFLDVEEKLTKKYFGLLLTHIGFNNDDTFVLSGFTTKDFQMAYKVISKDKKVTKEGKFEIVFDYDFKYGMHRPLHSITVINNNERTKYEYDYVIPDVSMQSHVLNDSETGLSFTREFERNEYKSTLENHEYKFSISIKKKIVPGHGTYSRSHKMEPYNLTNEGVLEEYLQSLSFPIDVVEAYKKICEISLNNLDDYSEINLKVEKKVNKDELVVTDEILLHGKEKVKLTLTTKDKTVTRYENGNYSYNCSSYSANKGKNQYTQLTFNYEKMPEADQFISPCEVLNDIENDVDEVEKVMIKLVSVKRFGEDN